LSKIIPVEFHGDTLVAVEHAEDMYVAIRPICDAIGIHADRQKERIQRDAVLREGTHLKSPSGEIIRFEKLLRSGAS
jgi:ribosome-associated translation inhibitor RaiA